MASNKSKRPPKPVMEPIRDFPVKLTTDILRPNDAIMRFAQTIGTAKQTVGVPDEEQAFLDDLEAVLAYLAHLERKVAVQ